MASNEQKKTANSVLQRSKTWMVVTNINCVDGEVKVYDSIVQYLDRASLRCIESLVKQRDAVPQIKMPRCRKQAGTKDCDVYAIAFAAAIAFGKNPENQFFKQEVTSSCML